MPSSSTSTFSEPDDFEAALRKQTEVDLLVTGPGQFRGRLTQVALHRLHLAVGDEALARVAFITMRPGLILVWWMLGRRSSQVWCGTPTLPGEIMTLGPGERAHARTDGATRWAGVWISPADLARFSQALTGSTFTVAVGASSWQPSPTASRTLRALHAAAIKLFESRPGEVLAASSIRGLEQQMIHALVECLSSGVAGACASKRHRRIITCFEDACVTTADRMPGLVEICTMLGVPERTLRTTCEQYLGMGPMSYLRLRRMNLVRRALRAAQPASSNVQQLARRHGFNELGRFAAKYRKLFGELPSATLQRNPVVN